MSRPRYFFAGHTTEELQTLASELATRTDLRHKLAAVQAEIQARQASAAAFEARDTHRHGAVSEA